MSDLDRLAAHTSAFLQRLSQHPEEGVAAACRWADAHWVEFVGVVCETDEPDYQGLGGLGSRT